MPYEPEANLNHFYPVTATCGKCNRTIVAMIRDGEGAVDYLEEQACPICGLNPEGEWSVSNFPHDVYFFESPVIEES